MRQREVDVVVVGGGAAGLNGALMLARSRRDVVVLDAGEPRNAPAHAIHGLLGHDGTAPGDLLARGRSEVQRYGGEVIAATAKATDREGDRIAVTLQDDSRLLARRLLVATGVVDLLPQIEGLAEHWGQSVVHCPFCHGYEVRDQPIGVLATGPMSVHQALMFRQLSDDVLFLAHTFEPSAEQQETLAAVGIPVASGRVVQVLQESGRLSGVRLEDGHVIERQALAVASGLQPRVEFLAGLGVEAVEHPSGVGRHLVAGPTGQTETPGVWAAGNVTDLMAQVGVSAAAGAMAGAHLHGDLLMEDTAAALERYRAGR